MFVTRPFPSKPKIWWYTVDCFPSSYSCLCLSFQTAPLPLSGFPAIKTPIVVLLPEFSSPNKYTFRSIANEVNSFLTLIMAISPYYPLRSLSIMSSAFNHYDI